MAIQLTDRNRIADTALSLPPLGFGAAHLGGMYNRVPGPLAVETLSAAWRGGIRFFDTAPFYGRGLSEHRVGAFLIDQPRDSFVLTTKVGRVFRRAADPETFDRAPWGGGLNFEYDFDYTYDGFMRSYEQSLFRLGLDRVDALLIHDPDAQAHGDMHAQRMKDMSESGIKALDQLKASGDIKAIGMGLNAAESLTDIAPLVDLDFAIVAMPYTLLDQSALGQGMQHCVDKNISVIIGAPYASGILATGPGPRARYRYGIAEDVIQDKVKRIQTVCANHAVTLQSAALQFPLAHPSVISIIPGGAKPDETEANIGFAQEVIPPAFWSDLKSEGLIDARAPVQQ